MLMNYVRKGTGILAAGWPHNQTDYPVIERSQVHFPATDIAVSINKQ